MGSRLSANRRLCSFPSTPSTGSGSIPATAWRTVHRGGLRDLGDPLHRPADLNVPEIPAAPGRPQVSFFRSYAVLVQDIKKLFRESRPTFWFLPRARSTGWPALGLRRRHRGGGLRFEAQEVIIFGVAANLVAGASTIIAGRFDDIFGARAVILTALIGLVISGFIVFFLHDAGTIVFWVFGLALCLFVGPAQASSRSLLARVTPAGREGEIFGLYATTGRAASFLSPALWTLFILIFGATYWGILASSSSRPARSDAAGEAAETRPR